MLKAHCSFSWTAAHLHQADITSRLTSGHNGLWGGGWGGAMCRWQIPLQRNEAHRHSGSCDTFLRPDGTQCYPRGLILVPPAPRCCNRNLYSLMTHCSDVAGYILWAILLKREEPRSWPCWCMMPIHHCLSLMACVGLENVLLLPN